MKTMQIEGYSTPAGLTYFIREDGRVTTSDGRTIAPRVHKSYPFVNLRVDGRKVHRTIHRLLAKAFIPNPEGLPMVDHRDRNRLNFELTNLRWVTVKENSSNREFMYELDSGEVFDTTVQVAEYLGRAQSSVNQAVRNVTPCAGVFIKKIRRKFRLVVT